MNKQPTIRPFKALRFNLNKISDLALVIAPPYDVIGPKMQKALYEKSPHNIAWLDVTQEEGLSQPSDARYEKAAKDYRDWQENEILVRDKEPGIYVYEQEFEAPNGEKFTRRGFYGLRRLEAFGEGYVYPHERTLAGPKKDRLRLMKVTSTQMSPIFGLFNDPLGISAKLLAEAVKISPLFEIEDDNGQKHRLWYVTDFAWIEQLQAAVEESPFLIADGHHRYETALAYANWRKENQPNEIADYVLMFCEELEDSGLLVLPTHRAVHNRPSFSPTDFLAKVRDFFAVQEVTEANPEDWFNAIYSKKEPSTHTFGIVFKDNPTLFVTTLTKEALQKLTALSDVEEPLRSLDTAIVHKCFLEAFLGFTDKDQENTEFISYLKSEKDFLEEIKKPETQVGFILNAPPIPQIRAVAEAGQFMPPKSTFFYPKLPTGLVINLID